MKWTRLSLNYLDSKCGNFNNNMVGAPHDAWIEACS